MAHAQRPDFFFQRNGRVHLNRAVWRQFSRLLAAGVCASAVVMLDTPCSEVVWRVLATHCIRQFPLHFPSRPSPCAITFQLDSTTVEYEHTLQLHAILNSMEQSSLWRWRCTWAIETFPAKPHNIFWTFFVVLLLKKKHRILKACSLSYLCKSI